MSTMWKAIWNSPVGMIVGIVLGAVIGLYVKPLAQLLAPLGQIYVSLLTMCVLPIMITSIISG
ncbi:cation:dicarboxylate symporter family transporter, partial [Candidatus Entotheonella palauensis]|uniref:cation:dicarboxylate symporter family transporter n=1 Tax=Candidatus Entotheonella palauensis TaxID=93172 RepID=UPI0011786726